MKKIIVGALLSIFFLSIESNAYANKYFDIQVSNFRTDSISILVQIDLFEEDDSQIGLPMVFNVVLGGETKSTIKSLEPSLPESIKNRLLQSSKGLENCTVIVMITDVEKWKQHIYKFTKLELDDKSNFIKIPKVELSIK